MEAPLKVIKTAIRDIPDFPKEGIVFKDITPILQNASLFRSAVDELVALNRSRKIDKVVGIDARGFLFGAAAAYVMNVGFVPVRKQGKLPYERDSVAYALEYGEACVEMHCDAIQPGESVVLIDDLLATGGTAAAAVELIKRRGATLLEAQFLVELTFLNGRSRLADIPVRSLIEY